jgi:hypothetical protein
MSNSLQVKVKDYLAENIGLNSLQDFVMDLTLNDNEGQNSAVDMELASLIELKIGEFTSGYLLEDGLKAELLRLVGNEPTIIRISQMRWGTQTPTKILRLASA